MRIRRLATKSTIALGALAAIPSSAQAHLVNTGFGPIYDGATHLLLSPEDLLVVLALGILAGLRGKEFGRSVLFILPGAWCLGGILGLPQSEEILLPVVATLSYLILGVLAAADRKLSLIVIQALAGVMGLLHGFLNGSAMAAADLGASGLLGIAVVAFVGVTLVAAFVVSLRPDWTRVAVRVAGSWIAAIGLLSLGWLYRSGA